jgi:hypothetical protein
LGPNLAHILLYQGLSPLPRDRGGGRGRGRGGWTKYIFLKSFTVPFPSSEFRWIQQRVRNKTELELACASPNMYVAQRSMVSYFNINFFSFYFSDDLHNICVLTKGKIKF